MSSAELEALWHRYLKIKKDIAGFKARPATHRTSTTQSIVDEMTSAELETLWKRYLTIKKDIAGLKATPATYRTSTHTYANENDDRYDEFEFFFIIQKMIRY